MRQILFSNCCRAVSFPYLCGAPPPQVGQRGFSDSPTRWLTSSVLMLGAMRSWARSTAIAFRGPALPASASASGLVGSCATVAISAKPAAGPTATPGIFEPVEVRQIGLERRHLHAQEADERVVDRCPALKSDTGYPQTTEPSATSVLSQCN